MSLATAPAESDTYRSRRAELLDAERDLRALRIRVAALRRELPLDTPVEDYVFDELPADLSVDTPVTQVRLSELFTDPGKPLILYHFMYGGAQSLPCPSCTMWVDGFHGALPHVRQRAELAVVAQAPIHQFQAWACRRGWTSLRLLSGEPSSFKSDFGSQTPDGKQLPLISVFTKEPDGSLRHFYSGSATLDEQIREGGIDQLSPVWNLFDLTPDGRGEWYPAREYAD
jgi:predicted dithiol-disulfide oxidoreductase (DUF899 family)